VNDEVDSAQMSRLDIEKSRYYENLNYFPVVELAKQEEIYTI